MKRRFKTIIQSTVLIFVVAPLLAVGLGSLFFEIPERMQFLKQLDDQLSPLGGLGPSLAVFAVLLGIITIMLDVHTDENAESGLLVG